MPTESARGTSLNAMWIPIMQASSPCTTVMLCNHRVLQVLRACAQLVMACGGPGVFSSNHHVDLGSFPTNCGPARMTSCVGLMARYSSMK